MCRRNGRKFYFGAMKVFLILMMIALLASCNKATSAVADDIPAATMGSVGIDSALINNMTKAIRNHEYSKWNEEVPYNDPENSEIKMTKSADPMEFVLSQPMDTIPGAVWKYNGGTTQLLAGIIKKVSDQRIFFNKEADLIVVSMAGNYNQWDLPKHPGTLLNDFIYPAIKE